MSDENHEKQNEKSAKLQILDGEFFKISDEPSSSTTINAQCMLCMPQKVIIKGYNSSNSNFFTHLSNEMTKNSSSIVIQKIQNDNDDFCDFGVIVEEVQNFEQLAKINMLEFLMILMKIYLF